VTFADLSWVAQVEGAVVVMVAAAVIVIAAVATRQRRIDVHIHEEDRHDRYPRP
jgi:riboflavin synthase